MPTAGADAGGGERALAAAPDAAPAGPVYPPRIVRQRPGLARRVVVEVEGKGRRAVDVDSLAVLVSDPDTGEVWFSERFAGDVWHVGLDPSFRRLCLAERHVDGNVIGAYDLAEQRWLWTTREDGFVLDVVAGPDRCFVRRRTPEGTATVALALEDGTPMTGDVPAIPLGADRRLLWSTDLRRLYATVRARPAGSAADAQSVKVFETPAMTESESFWAECIEARTDEVVVGFDPVEPPQRRQQVASRVGVREASCPAVPDEGHEEILRLADPWVPLPDGRILYHADFGLYLWDWTEPKAPHRIDAMPVSVFVDSNGRTHPIDPVADADGGWIGAVDEEGVLRRWDTDGGATLESASLPGPRGSSPDDAQWQIFSAPGGRLAVLRDGSGGRRLYVGSVDGNDWARSDVEIFGSIEQYVRWAGRDGQPRWLLGEPHFGVRLIDASRGTVLAEFSPPPTYSRNSSAALSPDGARVFVGVDSWPRDDAAGLYVLDATTLDVISKFPWDEDRFGTVSAYIDWTDTGIIVGGAVGVTDFAWGRVDPADGTYVGLPLGRAREARGYGRGVSLHLHRLRQGNLAMASATLEAEGPILGLDANGSFIESPDGALWCDGAACAKYRCLVEAETLAPVDDPACAALLRRPE
ncbi:MAG: hypothetical protein HY905_21095 [Deltaproteobacteria bacterium]|nr:hypothetical protein [Deltaproteobacteria bacterium]